MIWHAGPTRQRYEPWRSNQKQGRKGHFLWAIHARMLVWCATSTKMATSLLRLDESDKCVKSNAKILLKERPLLRWQNILTLSPTGRQVSLQEGLPHPNRPLITPCILRFCTALMICFLRWLVLQTYSSFKRKTSTIFLQPLASSLYPIHHYTSSMNKVVQATKSSHLI